jgi:excisionase family DNA binding protein
VLAYAQAQKGERMLIGTKEASQRLGVHPATIRRWAASGRVRYVRIGRERAIPAEEVGRLKRERMRTHNVERRRSRRR